MLGLLLSAMSSACATGNPPSLAAEPAGLPAAQALGAIDPGYLNKRIRSAAASGEPWVKRLEWYVLKLFGMDELRSFQYQLTYSSGEQAAQATIRLERDGMLDDAQRGDLQIISVARQEEGYWLITGLQKGVSCWRSEQPVYATRPCP